MSHLLKAYKSTTFARGRLDHTYVLGEIGSEQNDNPQVGHVWNCLGGDGSNKPKSKRNQIKEAEGYVENWEKAKILGGEKGAKGIIYGFNGVCHTMCNRVLAETLKTVNHDVKGGTASALAYGFYGIRCPPAILRPIANIRRAALMSALLARWIASCKKAKLKVKPRLKTAEHSDGLMQETAEVELKMIEAQDALVNDRGSVEKLVLCEMKYLIASKLGPDGYEKEGELLLNLTSELTNCSGAFKHFQDQDIKSNGLTCDEFVAQLSKPINEALGQCQTIFRRDDYNKLFGLSVGEDITLVDPEIFAGTYKDPDEFIKIADEFVEEISCENIPN